MYFEVENTPERIRKARRIKVQKEEVLEEIPRLLLAPFSRPPQVFFENVPVGVTAERCLEIANPSIFCEQITLAGAPPPGLIIQLPEQWLTVEPETCYTVSLLWTPGQPTALRHTLRFTNNSRGRFDVIVILKTAVLMEKSKKPTKKISPGKVIKRTLKKSPASTYKKKADIIYKTTHIKKTYNTVQSSYLRTTYSANKENIMNDYSLEVQGPACPFGSPNSLDFIEVDDDLFSNVKKANYKYIESETFDKTNNSINQKVLKPSNKGNIDVTDDIFDNLTFTPLKTMPPKNKLAAGPKIVISVNSESDFETSFDSKGNKENETHSIICINTTQPNKWLQSAAAQPLSPEYQHHDRLNKPTKIIPNTSSPKELNSPNFSLHTDFSRISDLSFYPQKHSTDKKILPRDQNETLDYIEDHINSRLNSDTYTKESPNERPSHFAFMEPRPTMNINNPKICRQSLFRDIQQPKGGHDKGSLHVPFYATDGWHNELRVDSRSPPRSITPPLQSIPEESMPLYESHFMDKSDRQTATFSINRTFDKSGRNSLAPKNSWSKKDVKATEVWKVPVSVPAKLSKSKIADRTSISGIITNYTFDANNSAISNGPMSLATDVYSQSLTVDPFLSKTYFFDEQAVGKFEEEFKRWLNCILTPPADLDSNVDQKVDVGKAWLENRNKDIPEAPTKEQVCSAYHNSYRLESLRRAARSLLSSPEIVQVLTKLTAQIEKKLIAIRNDRNLHLDVGLQKAVMRILMSYNPLWLRIGLETLYSVVIPLKSNSDMEGLTTFVVQRMFKNPNLKNKHTKANAPNMLLPAYIEAVKKYTLKKFFSLVFFLDQAKQKKLIPHDPCLFCRNAMCKESRDILINFTKEVIAGIGDITRHLRPLGYVVSHKQSFIDEYKYAVHNIAIDLRDGVRITKVMEIILMKQNLLNQLRTPAISRLQKIHNVQVAFNALKEANFTIVGDIAAIDIADGHREKTLSFLWQLIHVFRAPLFTKAANVIQMWWRSKLQVILAKRREEEIILEKRNRAASMIQRWWRKIQYSRYLEYKTKCTITLQAYVRGYLARKFVRALRVQIAREEYERHLNCAATAIQNWWRSKWQIIVAKKQLKEMLRQRRFRAATVIQTWWLRIQFKRYLAYKLMCTIKLQACVRSYLARKLATALREQKAKEDLERKLNQAAVKIQSAYRGHMARTRFNTYKKAVNIIQQWWRAKMQIMFAKQLLQEMIKARRLRAAISIQSWYRRMRFLQYIALRRRSAIKLQAAVRGFHARKLVSALKEQKAREELLRRQNCAAIKIQALIRGRIVRSRIAADKNAAITIQNWWRSKLQIKSAQTLLQELRQQRRRRFAITIQSWWLRVKFLRYIEYKRRCIIKLQAYARGYCARRLYRALKDQKAKEELEKKRNNAATVIQALYRGYKVRSKHSTQKKAANIIQSWWRSKLIISEAKDKLKELREKRKQRAANSIRNWWKTIQHMRYLEYRLRCTIKLQAYTRGYLARRLACSLREQNDREELQRKRNSAATRIQATYRGYVIRKQINAYKKSANIIQAWWKSKLQIMFAKKLLQELMLQRRIQAAVVIQSWWRKIQAMRYLELKRRCAVRVQALVRGFLARKLVRSLMEQKAREELERKRNIAAIKLQALYRGYVARSKLTKNKKAAIIIQTWWRIKIQIMREERLTLKRNLAAKIIQTWWRQILQRQYLEKKRNCTIKLQAYLRGYLARKLACILREEKARKELERKQIEAAIKIQALCRGYLTRSRLNKYKKSIKLIQTWWKAKLQAITAKRRLEKEVHSALKIQNWWRKILYYRFIEYKTMCTITLQTYIRRYLAIKRVKAMREEKSRKEFEKATKAAIIIQSMYRGHRVRSMINADVRLATLRQRWREGALATTSETLQERNEGVMMILGNMADIESVIQAVASLESLTEVYPALYDRNASAVVDRVYICMAVTNRSISSIEVLKCAGAVLCNLARYKVTGPMIYKRSRIAPILKFMSRFTSDVQLFRILCTYLWIFSKYNGIREDISEYLCIPENYKLMSIIKTNVARMKRMETRSTKCKITVNKRHEHLLPDPEPDYGIRRSGKTAYFHDSLFAVKCLFQTYNLCNSNC